MRREFDYFDDDVITQEFGDLPAKDAASLITVMDHYEKIGLDDPKPAKVQDYGENISPKNSSDRKPDSNSVSPLHSGEYA